MATKTATTSLSKLLCVILAIVVAASLTPAPALATTSKNVKKQTFTTTTATIKSKATTVKKGTTKLTYKQGVGYIKFKAKKTKYYSFTVSNVKSSKYSAATYLSAYKPSKYNGDYVTVARMKTKGKSKKGMHNTLWLSANGYSHSGTMLYRPLSTRTGKIKLNKGEVLYLYLGNGSGGKTTLTLKIK